MDEGRAIQNFYPTALEQRMNKSTIWVIILDLKITHITINIIQDGRIIQISIEVVKVIKGHNPIRVFNKLISKKKTEL